MKFLPLKGEVEAVMAVLADDTFEDEKAMATAIVKTLALVMARRESYAVAVSAGPPFEFFWPFYYHADAAKFADQLGLMPGERKRMLLKMHSPIVDLEARAKQAAENAERVKYLNWPGPGQTLTIPGGKRPR